MLPAAAPRLPGCTWLPPRRGWRTDMPQGSRHWINGGRPAYQPLHCCLWLERRTPRFQRSTTLSSSNTANFACRTWPACTPRPKHHCPQTTTGCWPAVAVGCCSEALRATTTRQSEWRCGRTRPPKHDEPFDATGDATFSTDGTDLRLWSITAAMGARTLQLPTAGTYHVRAYVSGQADIEAAEATEPASFAEGLERWLVQIWPV